MLGAVINSLHILEKKDPGVGGTLVHLGLYLPISGVLVSMLEKEGLRAATDLITRQMRLQLLEGNHHFQARRESVYCRKSERAPFSSSFSGFRKFLSRHCEAPVMPSPSSLLRRQLHS